MLTAQALSKHEGVLRADRDDEAEAQGQALNEHREGKGIHGCRMPAEKGLHVLKDEAKPDTPISVKKN